MKFASDHIFSLDFRKDWQRRVRVHFDQVRNRTTIHPKRIANDLLPQELRH